MQECTPEIIIRSAKRAGLTITKFTPHNEAFLISNPSNGKSFVASPWSIYPTQRSWHAGVMKYKELSSHLLERAGFTTIQGKYLYTPDFDNTGLFDEIMAYSREIGFPLVIKPNTGSSSRNVAIIRDEKSLMEHIPSIKEHITDLLIQKYIQQREYRVFIYKGELVYVYEKQFVNNSNEVDRLHQAPLDKDTMIISDFPTYLRDFAQKLYESIDAEIIGLDIFVPDNIKQEQKITNHFN